jgi:ABC-type multidrug transport system fused ATPase/permease subunit
MLQSHSSLKIRIRVLLAIILASTNLTSLAPHFVDFSQAASAAAKLFNVIDRISDIDPFEDSGLMPSTIDGDIALNNVSFSYPTRPSMIVLHNFSLVIPSGKVTALVVSPPLNPHPVCNANTIREHLAPERALSWGC